MAQTFAEQLVDTLVAQGVKRIFGLVGDSLNPVVDAVRRTEGIEWIHVHNEESAAFAAGAESQITGELAVCAGSCGPGNTHLVQGLYDAHRNGAKVLAIASHIPTTEIGTGFFQETHPQELLRECSSYCEVVHSAAQGGRILHIAIQSALATSGVSVLVLPGDVAAQPAAAVPALGAVADLPARLLPDPRSIDRLAQTLNRAQKVTLFAGAGVRGSHDLVLRLAEVLKAPVGHALGGKEWIQYDNPFDVGMSGLLGYGACYEACNEAEVLLMLGTDFPYVAFLPDGNRAQIVQVDRDASHLGRRAKLSQAIHADVAATIEALLPQLETKNNRRFLDSMLKRHERLLSTVVDAYTARFTDSAVIHPETLADSIDELLTEDAVVTVDTGMCNVWAARYLTPNGRRRVIGSWHHGTMANALPQAIGIAAAAPKRQVVTLSGDGGLAMLLGELLTVRRQNLDIKIVVFNNSSLGMVKLDMLVEGFPDFGTDHAPVNYAAIAGAIGLPSVQISEGSRLKTQLAEAFARPGPVLIDVVTDANALSMPPSIEFSQVKGFALAAGKTVLTGGVGKMLALAKSNLRNIPH